MALTTNRDVDHFVDQEIRRYPMAASVQIFKGGFVGLNLSKYARALEAGDKCVGLAYDAADNTQRRQRRAQHPGVHAGRLPAAAGGGRPRPTSARLSTRRTMRR